RGWSWDSPRPRPRRTCRRTSNMNSSETSVLQLLLTRGIGSRTLDRVLAALTEEGVDLTDLLRGPVESWGRFGLKPSFAAAIAATRSEAEQLRERLRGNDIKLLVKGTPAYPTRLQRSGKGHAPPVLFAQGNLAI